MEKWLLVPFHWNAVEGIRDVDCEHLSIFTLIRCPEQLQRIFLFTSFTKQQFDEQFTKRRRTKTADIPSLTPDAYAEVKATMQDQLNQFEQKVSEKAAPPKETSMAVSMAPTNGKTLAAKLASRGVVIPAKVVPPAP